MNRKCFLIDLQGFKDDRNEFIIKEIAIMNIKNCEYLHWFVKQPYPINKLSPALIRQANYVSKFYHGIPYNYGNIPFYVIKKKLKEIISYNLVLVKGSEKRDFLQRIFKKAKIEDLSDIPSLKKLKPRFNNYYCSFHSSNQLCLFFSCALNNVYNIYAYIMSTGYKINV